jgi:hypothetical protein
MPRKFFKIIFSVFILITVFNFAPFSEKGEGFGIKKLNAQSTDLGNVPFQYTAPNPINDSNSGIPNTTTPANTNTQTPPATDQTVNTTNPKTPATTNPNTANVDNNLANNPAYNTQNTTQVGKTNTTYKAAPTEKSIQQIKNEIEQKNLEITRLGANKASALEIQKAQAERTALQAELAKAEEKNVEAGKKCSDGFFGAIWCSAKEAVSVIFEGPLGILYLIINGLLLLIQHLAQWIFQIVASVLDFAIIFSINISTYISPMTDSIDTTWALIRDVFNVIFVFLLLYISIKTIIGTSITTTKQMLGSIVLAAVLVNFSMFITKTLIDVSNLISLTLYNKVTIGGSVATYFMQVTGITETLNSPVVGGGINSIIFNSTNAALLIIAIWAFGTMAMLFLVRGALFIILIVTSPVAIAGSLLPMTKEYSTKWWDALNSQLLVAPIFFIFLLLTFKFAVGLKSVQMPIVANSVDMSPIFKYGLIITILIIGTNITKKTSGAAGQMLTNIAKTGMGMALGLATGGAALAGSALIGGAASRIMSPDRIAKLKERTLQGGIGGQIASLQLKVGEAAKKGTYDVRNTGLGQYTQKKTGLNLGTGNKTSYSSRTEAEVKAKTEKLKLADEIVQDKAKAYARTIPEEDLKTKREGDVKKKEDKIKEKHEGENLRLSRREADISDKAAAELRKTAEEARKATEKASQDYKDNDAKKKAEIDRIEEEKKRKLQEVVEDEKRKKADLEQDKKDLAEKQKEEKKKNDEEIEIIESDGQYANEREAIKADFIKGKVGGGDNLNLEAQKQKSSYAESVSARPWHKKLLSSAHYRREVAEQIRDAARPKKDK